MTGQSAETNGVQARAAGGTGARLVAEAGRLSGASILIYFVSFVSGFLLGRILDTVGFGIYRLFAQNVMSYTQFSNLGISHGIDRIGPSLISKGRMDRYRALMGVSTGFSLLLSGLVACGLLVAAVVVESAVMRIALVVVALFVPLQQLMQHADLSLMYEKRFFVSAKLQVIVTCLRAVLILGLGWWLGAGGALGGVLIATMVHFALLAPRTRMGFRLALRRSLVVRLLVTGAPITALLAGDMLVATCDKLVVAALIGGVGNGLYQMAVFPLQVLSIVPLAFRQVVSIEIYDKVGHARNPAAARDFYRSTLLVVALTYPFVAGVVIYGLPWLIHAFLPKYTECIDTLIAHAVLIYPWLVTQMGLAMLVVTHQEWRTVLVQVLLAGVVSLSSIAAITRAGAGIETVLLIHGAGWVLYGFVLLTMIDRGFGGPLGSSLLRAAGSLAPMIYLALAIAAEVYLLRAMALEKYSFVYSATGGLLHLAACIPLFVLLERRTGQVSRALGVAKRMLGGN